MNRLNIKINSKKIIYNTIIININIYDSSKIFFNKKKNNYHLFLLIDFSFFNKIEYFIIE